MERLVNHATGSSSIYLERARIFLLLRFKRRIRFLAHFSRMAVLNISISRVKIGVEGWMDKGQEEIEHT